MIHRTKTEERDELRARFTSWLTTMLQRARLDYQRKLKREIQTIPIDDVPEEFLIASDDSVLHSARISADFFFEEEKLAHAYAKMPLMRRRILQLLFIEEMKPDEVAKQMNCSPQYVYNQRLKALKQFRKALSEGGDPDEKG